jgi:hypothetical protein
MRFPLLRVNCFSCFFSPPTPKQRHYTVTTLLESYTPGQIAFIRFLQDHRSEITVYDTCTVTRRELVDVLAKGKYVAVPAWIAATRSRRAGRGNYFIPEINVDPNTLPVNTNHRGRKPGSRNRKGRAPAAPTTGVSPVGT